MKRCAAASAAANCADPVVESHNKPIRRRPGAAWSSNSSHLPARSGKLKQSPVTLPPGRARLWARPLSPGSRYPPYLVSTSTACPYISLGAQDARSASRALAGPQRAVNVNANIRQPRSGLVPSNVLPLWRKVVWCTDLETRCHCGICRIDRSIGTTAAG